MGNRCKHRTIGEARGQAEQGGPGPVAKMSGGSGVPSSERLKSVLSSLPVPPTSLKKVPETQQQQEQQLYRPWDRASLLKRAATFKAHLWFGKPSVVSAMECARHGWICIEPDLLECEVRSVASPLSCSRNQAPNPE